MLFASCTASAAAAVRIQKYLKRDSNRHSNRYSRKTAFKKRREGGFKEEGIGKRGTLLFFSIVKNSQPQSTFEYSNFSPTFIA
jgi:hypothetical protein